MTESLNSDVERWREPGSHSLKDFSRDVKRIHGFRKKIPAGENNLALRNWRDSNVQLVHFISLSVSICVIYNIHTIYTHTILI